MTQEFTTHMWDGVDESILSRYAELLSFVYKREISAAHIIWKHKHNPVGPSLVSYAENEQGEMVAARALWLMYSNKAPVYQPCDTVTRQDAQRRGLFSTLTRMCLDELPSDAMVVNFPNNNSYPAYLKLGWQLYAENKKVFSFGLPMFKPEIHDLDAYLEGKVSDEKRQYLAWRFSPDSQMKYICREHSKGVLVENGSQSGFIPFESSDMPFSAGSGIQMGYAAPQMFSAFSAFFKGAIGLNCSSRTAFLLRDGANIDTLNAFLQSAQLNTLMDTF